MRSYHSQLKNTPRTYHHTYNTTYIQPCPASWAPCNLVPAHPSNSHSRASDCAGPSVWRIPPPDEQSLISLHSRLSSGALLGEASLTTRLNISSETFPITSSLTLLHLFLPAFPVYPTVYHTLGQTFVHFIPRHLEPYLGTVNIFSMNESRDSLGFNPSVHRDWSYALDNWGLQVPKGLQYPPNHRNKARPVQASGEFSQRGRQEWAGRQGSPQC